MYYGQYCSSDMAKIDLTIPSLGSRFVDIRETISGDSFNWSWTRPLSQVVFLAIHHTAGPDSQTPEQIANFHISSNGWGGIGYHFLVDKNGIVYYVGDISTARANVANLNDQVIGICLIGSFMSGKEPTDAQINSAKILCDFFINNYPDLANLNSYDQVKGHKELPGQSTACPGETWPLWKTKITSAPIESGSGSPTPLPTSTPVSDRGAKITESYRKVLGRDPDMGGLQTYTNGLLSIDQIVWSMVASEEHQNLIMLAKEAEDLKNQVDNMQTSLTSVNQQLLILQESLRDKDEEINRLRAQSSHAPSNGSPQPPKSVDNTLTIADLFINLYKFIFPSRKEAPIKSGLIK
ncbi:N-acetylmuramoyl-L-alanine amidase [Candidatus Daviesbacteria bacterium]|nr:N-acetylmuramoyl-L-alanine amidase [Candidatus Daviesbacteria bacterium]